jgi:hypothetical protein
LLSEVPSHGEFLFREVDRGTKEIRLLTATEVTDHCEKAKDAYKKLRTSKCVFLFCFLREKNAFGLQSSNFSSEPLQRRNAGAAAAFAVAGAGAAAAFAVAGAEAANRKRRKRPSNFPVSCCLGSHGCRSDFASRNQPVSL